jgi:E3 ubiquitin-protein ligase HUWE1
MVEASTTETLAFIAKIVKESLDETEGLRDDHSGESKYLKLANTEGEYAPGILANPIEHYSLDEAEATKANDAFRKLVTLHVRIMLLSDIFATAGFAQGRALTSLLQSVTGHGTGDILFGLGSLHRSSIWENVMLKSNIASPASTSVSEDKPEVADASPPVETPVSVSSEATTPGGTSTPTAANGFQPEGTATPTPRQETPTKLADPRETNVKALKHLASQIPNGLAPFFQCRSKLNCKVYDAHRRAYSRCKAVPNKKESRCGAEAANP